MENRDISVLLREWLVKAVFVKHKHQWIPSTSLYALFQEQVKLYDFIDIPNQLGKFSKKINKVCKSFTYNIKIHTKRLGPKNELHYMATDASTSEHDIIFDNTYVIHSRPLRSSKAAQIIKQYHDALSLQHCRHQNKHKHLNTVINMQTGAHRHRLQDTNLLTVQREAVAPSSLYEDNGAHLTDNATTSTTTTSSTTVTSNTSITCPFHKEFSHPCFTERAKDYIFSSYCLDFEMVPRPDFQTMGRAALSIPLRPEKQLSKGMKWHMVVVAASHGYLDLPSPQKKKLAEAVTRRESYLAGYHKPPSAFTFHKWWQKYTNQTTSNCSSIDPDRIFDSCSGKNRLPYVTYIEQRFPKLLHSLYRYATKLLGVDATVPMLLSMMNSKARLDNPFCEVRSKMNLTKHHFWIFFNKHGGKVKAPTTRPTLTDDQKRKRVEFCTKNKERVRNSKKIPFYHCFLDEKWMYTTSRRKKLKILPIAEWEDPNEALVPQPKIRSRRHACKIMYLGVVAPPDQHHCFDGKILLKRCCRARPQKRLSHNKNFTPSFLTNNMIVEGEWRELVGAGDITSDELILRMKDTYGLSDDVASRIVFSYRSFPLDDNNNDEGENVEGEAGHGDDKKKGKPIRIADRHCELLKGRKIRVTPSSEPRPLTLNDLYPEVRVDRYTIVMEDVTCDSAFMMETVHEIGRNIRSSFYWVKKDIPIHLFLDNAGGHGTIETRGNFGKILKDEYNVEVNLQVPNSPETNMLDLGVWMSFQNLIEKIHTKENRRDSDTLSESVCKAWIAFNGFAKLKEVSERWKLVLDLILADNGGNNKVENCRGLKRPLRSYTQNDTNDQQYKEYDDDEASCSDLSMGDDDDCN